MKECKYCKKNLIRKENEGSSNYKNRKYCNQECAKADKKGKPRPPKLKDGKGSLFICLNCNNKFIRSRSHQKYCGSKCQMQYEYKTGIRDKNTITKKANETVVARYKEKFKTNPTITRSKRGYLMIYISQVGWKQMHHYVWEKHNGIKPKGMHIHHIDGNKDNNDISNLRLMTNSEHLKLHWRIKKGLE